MQVGPSKFYGVHIFTGLQIFESINMCPIYEAIHFLREPYFYEFPIELSNEGAMKKNTKFTFICTSFKKREQ